MNQHVIGVDIGGTTVKLALVEAAPHGNAAADPSHHGHHGHGHGHAHVSHGAAQPASGVSAGPGAAQGAAAAAPVHRILRTGTLDTRPQDPGPETARRIAAAVKDLFDAANLWHGRLDGVGVGCPGLVNCRDGSIVVSANLPNFRNLPLAALLESHLNVPVAVQNDANAAALGEFHFGASARGCRNLVLLTLGTGVGGGVICDGKLLVGADNAAAELGHVKVDFAADAALCGCGRRGCVEAYAGIAGIGRIARAVLGASPTPSALAPLVAGGTSAGASGNSSGAAATNLLTTKALTDAARAGDGPARAALAAVGTYLGRAIANFVETFNPEKVVLAGGASRATEFLLPGIRQAMNDLCSFAATRDRATVEASALPDDINVLGAAAVFLDK